MTNIFISLVDKSINAGWLILAVIVVRFLLKDAPKFVRCILWCLVGIRLLIPFSIESTFSLVPSRNVMPPETVYSVSTENGSEMWWDESGITENYIPIVDKRMNPLPIAWSVGTYIWIVGMIFLGCYTIITYVRLKRRMRDAVRLQGNIFQSEKVKTPFVMGVVKLVIYIPYHLTEAERECVIAHERAHIKRGDHFWKPIAFAVLTLYWFQPLVWLAYVLFCKDIELACDEKVLREIGLHNKRVYSQTLLDCSVTNHTIAACPIAFGETGVKMRIKNIVNYKKPTLWILLLSFTAVAVVTVCFMTSPKEVQTEEVVLEKDAFVENVVGPETKSYAEESEETEEATGTGVDVSFLIPVEGEVYASFGESLQGVMHEGIDIAAEEGTAILATADGTVLDAGFNPLDGNFVVIEHDGGYYSTYAHCKDVFVENGEEVTSGMKIATVGNTGMSTGAHLHFEIQKDETGLIDAGMVIEFQE